MRFARTSLLDGLTGSGRRECFVLLEAPSGFGKSWVARRVAAPGAVRSRADVSVLDDPHAVTVGAVIDDAHLLTPAGIHRLLGFIDDVGDTASLVVAGRFLPDAVHEAAGIVDGVVLDANALAITADEIVEVAPSLGREQAERIVDSAQGSVRIIAAVLDRWSADPAVDVIAAVHQLERAESAAVLRALSSVDAGVVGLLARSPEVDASLLEKLGGPTFGERAVAAGVPLRRQVSGGVELGNAGAYRGAAIDAAGAQRLAAELVERDRQLEAASLLVDSGAHDRAGALLAALPASALDAVAPRAMLAVLARLGAAVDGDPALLLLRAAAFRRTGRFDRSGRDLDKAMEVVGPTDSPLRRRVLVDHAARLWLEGHAKAAAAAAKQALRDLGPGEDATLATAHRVLAEVAGSSLSRESLQRAADEYRSAIDAWEGCGEHAKARRCILNLALAVLVPLGRFDDALGHLQKLLAETDLSETERTWIVLGEGFVLLNANRLESADERFARVADIGQLHDDARVVASAAWGRAMVAARRDDLATTLRWIGAAENSALGPNDDLLGVPFLCDVATALGGLGEIALAARYAAKARGRSEISSDGLAFTGFVLAARSGDVGDVDEQLGHTAPAEWWRVELVAALALARRGELDAARRWFGEARRELVVQGLPDFKELGERRAAEELQQLLSGVAPAAAGPAPRERTPAVTGARRLRVIGGPMSVDTDAGAEEVPAGNPQRLVGAVVAHGGSATFDQLSEAIWPGEDVETSRTRLRNVLLRLRRGAGNVVVRSGSGVRLATDVTCDLHEFERLATDALASARSDPDLAGHLASSALDLVDGPVFADFEYEEWAVEARRRVENRLLGLLDFLSVQAEDVGDLPLAQSLAERALRLDRYTDSRYVRLAELMTLQGRNAAAVAVIEDAAQAARELGGALPHEVAQRREDLLRRAATS